MPCITCLKLATCLEFQVALIYLPLVLNLFQNNGKWAILGQLKNKIQKMSSLSITRKNKLFPQYPIRKSNVFSLIVLWLSKQISLSDTEVIFYVLNNNFFYNWKLLFLIFRKIFTTFRIMLALFFFFFFSKILTCFTWFSRFLFFLFSERF